ncbi:hypothetical protein YC2023_056040 [Brassica napus]
MKVQDGVSPTVSVGCEGGVSARPAAVKRVAVVAMQEGEVVPMTVKGVAVVTAVLERVEWW